MRGQGIDTQDVDVTLVHSRNYHLFQADAYQGSTGSLCPAKRNLPLANWPCRYAENTKKWHGSGRGEEAISMTRSQAPTYSETTVPFPYDRA